MEKIVLMWEVYFCKIMTFSYYGFSPVPAFWNVRFIIDGTEPATLQSEIQIASMALVTGATPYALVSPKKDYESYF